MGLVAETRSTLGSLAGVLELLIDRAALENVVTDLNKSIDDLETQAMKLLSVESSSFGASPAGAFVHQHSTMAYDAVMEALGALNSGMQHYITALKTLEKDADESEQMSAATTKKLRANLDAGTYYSHQGAGDSGSDS